MNCFPDTYLFLACVCNLELLLPLAHGIIWWGNLQVVKGSCSEVAGIEVDDVLIEVRWRNAKSVLIHICSRQSFLTEVMPLRSFTRPAAQSGALRLARTRS
jgi:hypothetical protein